MINLIRFFLICILTIVVRNSINKFIGSKARRDFITIEEDNLNRIINKINNMHIKCVILIVVVVFLAIINGNSMIKSCMCGGIAYCSFILFCYIQKKSERKEVLQDLLNVSECLRVQLSSNISLSIALKNISELCKNKVFSSYLTNVYLEYELSKFTVESSARELVRRFNYPEIKNFISAISQQSQSASGLEALDNLIEVLKEKYIEYIEENTKTKTLIMIFGVCIIVFNIAAMSVYPIIIEATESLKVMLL